MYISASLVLFYWSPLIINLALYLINHLALLNLYVYTHIQLIIYLPFGISAFLSINYKPILLCVARCSYFTDINASLIMWYLNPFQYVSGGFNLLICIPFPFQSLLSIYVWVRYFRESLDSRYFFVHFLLCFLFLIRFFTTPPTYIIIFHVVVVWNAYSYDWYSPFFPNFYFS